MVKVASGAGDAATPRRDAPARQRAHESDGASPPFRLEGLDADVPVLAAALHGGGRVSGDLHRFLGLDPAERWREEDAGTAEIASAFPARLLVDVSRFEVDLNRPPEQAVYLAPEEAWGLNVWRRIPPPPILERSRRIHRDFYLALRRALLSFAERHPRFVVLDLHSYNHRREGPDRPAEAAQNPEVNLGTAGVDRWRWGQVVDRFAADLRRAGLADVRENVKFLGGYFPAWIRASFGDRGLAIAVELKKTFVDEWTGETDLEELERIRRALLSTIPGLHAALERAR